MDFIYQKEEKLLQDTPNLQPIFSPENGFKTGVCKLYKFKAIICLKDLHPSEGNLYFGMLGDLDKISNIQYVAISNLGGETSGRNSQMTNGESFERTLLNYTSSNDDLKGRVLIEGTFKSDGISFLIPAIGFENVFGSESVLKGSYFEISEI
jgi:hypothetical protein